jgi:ABC-type dipeptide/oligopeptide/nickel transport system ATPase component
VAILYAGRVVELGTTAEVLDAPAHPVTRSMLSGTNLRPTSPLDRHTGCPYVAECPRRKLPQCTETEPLLAPLQTLDDPTGHGARRVACFFPQMESETLPLKATEPGR